MYNPVKSFVRHSLDDSEPEPVTDAYEMRKILGGELRLVCTPASERDEGVAASGEWIQARPEDVRNLEEAR